jgi:AraC-like DNA-binding protein
MEYKLQNFSSPMTVSRIANVHYFEFTGEYHTTDDAHNFCELLYVDKGTLHIHSEHYTGILESNQLIIHRANETHSLTCTENAYPHVMIIGFECHSPELYSFSQKPVTLRPAHRRQLAEVMKEGTNLFAPPYDIPNTPKMKKRKHYLFGADQMLKIHLESFLINLVRDKALLQSAAPETVFTENRLGEIRNYIEEHYTEKILLDNICFLFGTNKTTLCQSFRKEYGITILGYIDALKIRDAKKHLDSGILSVTEIAEQMGFSSIHYFCRYFKHHTGLSPVEYRDRNK